MTTSQADTRSRRAANCGFAALLFALFGWANLEVLLLTTNGGMRGQVLTTALGLFISAMAYRRCRFWRLPAALPTVSSSSAGVIAGGLSLAAAGFVLGYVMRMGFVTTTVIGGALFAFIPWSRSSFCRRYFHVSQALLLAGGLHALVTGVGRQHPVIVLGFTWLVWILAGGLVLIALWCESSGWAQLEPQVTRKPLAR